MALTPELARSIIKQAREDDTYEGPIPEDDDKALEAAQGLITMAEEAYAANVKGPEVESILRLAAEAENGASGDDDDDDDSKTEPESKGDPEPPLAAYDSLKASEIIANVEDIVEDGRMDEDSKLSILADISEYETNGKGRKTIIDAVSEAVEEVERVAAEAGGAPDPDPEPEGETEPESKSDADMDELAETEPWEGYAKDKVTDIIEGLEVSQEQDPEDEFNDLALNVWAYESAHKNRQRILGALEKMAGVVKEGGDEEGEDGKEEPPAAEAGTGEDPDAAASGDGAAGEGGVPEGAEDREGAEGASGEADAGAKARPRTRRASGKAAQEGPVDDGAEETDVAAQVTAELKRELLHIPPPIEAETVEMPFDLTTISDKELQRLHGAFSAYAYRINYLYMLEEAKARVYKEKADELSSALILEVTKIDDETNKPKTVALLEAEVAGDPNVKKARRAQHKHESFAESYRKQRDSYSKNVEVLSRQATLRHDEWERAGGIGSKGRK